MGSVRARITLIAALATAIAVSVVGFVLISQLDSSLRREVDESLERQVLNFELQIVELASLETVAVPIDPETLLVVVDADGLIVIDNDAGVEGNEVADQLGLRDAWLAGDLLDQVQFADISLTTPTETTGPGDMRAAYYELFPGDLDDETLLYVVVARSNDPTDRTVTRLRNAVLVGVPLLVAFVAALAWWLTGRALRPVDQMRREVDDIGATDLARRVSEPAARDEVGLLASTMNAMLGRLQNSQERQEQFVSDAAHELRTPLASIAAQLDVDSAHPASADLGQTASNVRVEVSRLQSLIDGLLSSARNEKSVVPAPDALLDLDVLAAEAVARVAKPSTVQVDQRGVGIGTVRGDETALASLVDNLLANAYRHATTSVAVTVGTDAAGIWLTVDDDGAGIDAADRERIFDRFTRLDEARSKDAGGSGLGLALARETAHRHSGTLHAEASELGGSRFVLRLPDAG